MTPPRPTFSSMKITFTPGSESLDRISRVPSVDPSSHASTSTVSPVLTWITSFNSRSIVARSLKIGTRTLKLARGGMRCP